MLKTKLLISSLNNEKNFNFNFNLLNSCGYQPLYIDKNTNKFNEKVLKKSKAGENYHLIVPRRINTLKIR